MATTPIRFFKISLNEREPLASVVNVRGVGIVQRTSSPDPAPPYPELELDAGALAVRAEWGLTAWPSSTFSNVLPF